MLERAVGSNGLITRVVLSGTMLAGSRRRAARHGWSNIELVRIDAASYTFYVQVRELYFGFVYLAVGEKNASSPT